MNSLTAATKNIILAIPDIETRLPGKIWERPILPEDSTGPDGVLWAATPEAFDPLQPIQVQRCMSINTPERTYGDTNWYDKYMDYVELWYYGPNTAYDRALLEETMEVVYDVLVMSTIRYASGSARIKDGRMRSHIKPTGEFFHAVYCVDRFSVHPLK